MKVAVVSPGRSSSGGSAFTQGLVPALEAHLGELVVTASIAPTGRFAGNAALQACSHVVFVGSRAQRIGSAKIIFWPLNVAPLERHVAKADASSLRNRLRHRALSYRLQRSVSAADGLVFGSSHARSLYQAYFPAAARKPYLINRGGSPSGLQVLPREPEDTNGDALVLLVSHLYPYKGIAEFVEAVALAVPQVPSTVRFRVAGADRDPRYAAVVRRRAAELGLNDRLEIRAADQDEMASLYARARIAVFTSTCENAGSFALYDGLHAGVPTICSDRSSMPEMVRGAVSLVNPCDPRDLSDAIVRLLSDPNGRHELAKRALAWSEDAPTWQQRAELLACFLNTMRAF